MAKIKMYTCFF